MSIIKSETWDGVTAPALPAGWTVDSALLTATTNSPSSAPNSLVHPAASADGTRVPHATWATLDTNNGNVQVSATARWANSAGAGAQDVWVFARSSAVAANATWGSVSYYFAAIYRNSASPGLSLSKRVGGTTTDLAIVGAGAFADATNYRIFLSCVGSSLHAQCQRLSDSFWLNSSGVFVSDPSGQTLAISATDTSIGAAAGYSGAAFYLANSTGGDLGLDDWLLEASLSATLSASPARLVAGSGAQTVTLTGANTHFSTSSSTQFTLSGGTGASIVSQSAASATAATLSIDPGTASGPLTITDTTDGSIATTIAVQATYYVSPTGSDSNTGLDSAHAWQTIARVNAQTLCSGDQVLLQGGQTFSGNLVLQNSGAPGHPIALRSYGPGAAVISPGSGTGIQIKDCSYVQLSNVVVAGPGVSSSGSTSSTTSTGAGVEVLCTQTQDAVASWLQSVHVSGVTVSGTYWGIHLHSSAGSDSGPYPVGYKDLRVLGCTVHDCLRAGIRLLSSSAPDVNNGDGLNGIGYHANVYIGSCVVYNIYGDSSLSTTHSGNGILVANVRGGITERCVVYACGQAQGNASGGGPVANWAYAAQDYSIQFCESHHMHDARQGDGGGFDLDGGCQSCTVQYCYSHDNEGTGYIVGTYAGGAATQNNTLRYNISQNDGRVHNCAAYRSFGAPTGTKIYHNTFYCDTPGTSALLVGPLAEGAFYNNIFWCGPGVALLGAVTAGTFAGNLYWLGGSAFSLLYNGVTYSSLAAFQGVQETASGVPTGVFADPALVAAGTGAALLPSAPVAALGAYELSASSPAIDAGLDLRALFGLDPGLIDVKGLPNLVGAGPDIGACEYGAGALLGGGGGGGGVLRLGLSGGIGG